MRSAALCFSFPCCQVMLGSTDSCSPQVGALIVSPTRELARQIYQVAEPFLDTIPWLKALLLVGGTYAPPPLDSCSLGI